MTATRYSRAPNPLPLLNLARGPLIRAKRLIINGLLAILTAGALFVGLGGFSSFIGMGSAAIVPFAQTPHWISWLAKSRNFYKHDHLIWESACAHGVDPALWKAIVMVESSGKERARSRVGAMGLSQLMPQTARSFGLTSKNRYDPKANLRAGAKHFSSMLDRFGGDVYLALAAYNAGPSIVASQGRIPEYGETQRFVSSVLTLYQWIQNDSLSLPDSRRILTAQVSSDKFSDY